MAADVTISACGRVGLDRSEALTQWHTGGEQMMV